MPSRKAISRRLPKLNLPESDRGGQRCLRWRQAALNLTSRNSRAHQWNCRIAQVQLHSSTPSLCSQRFSRWIRITTSFPINGRTYLRIPDKIKRRHGESAVERHADFADSLILRTAARMPLSEHSLRRSAIGFKHTGRSGSPGLLPNPGNILRPGQYGQGACVPDPQGALAISAAADIAMQGRQSPWLECITRSPSAPFQTASASTPCG